MFFIVVHKTIVKSGHKTTGTYGLKGHWWLNRHFYKTSILTIFGNSMMMGAISMSSWVIGTMFSQKNHVLSQLF